MHKLDFNALDDVVLELTMKDPDRTVIRVLTPTEGLLERLQAAVPEMNAITREKDPHRIRQLYELIAEVISCNDEHITVTAEDLRDKYKMSLGHLVVFMGRYLGFIRDIHKAKN